MPILPKATPFAEWGVPMLGAPCFALRITSPAHDLDRRETSPVALAECYNEVIEQIVLRKAAWANTIATPAILEDFLEHVKQEHAVGVALEDAHDRAIED